MHIQSDRDLRCAYELLTIYSEMEPKTAEAEERLHDHVCDLKREIRAYNRRNPLAVDVGMGFMCERRIVKDYGFDGFVELLRIPEEFDTLEDDGDERIGARTFFKDFIEIQARPSMYDCTGQAFTSWYKLFKRRGQYWAYHSVCFDV